MPNPGNWLNSLLPGVIRLKFEYSTKQIEFLDLRIIVENGKLETDLYVKPTSLQLFLDYCSNHPEHCKVGIVYSQALRVIERCSKQNFVDTHLQQLRCKFLERHYPPQIIDHNFEKAKQKNRRQLIFQPRKNKGGDNKIRLIFTHNQSNPPLHKWMREAKKTLVRNPKAKELGEKIQIATKQPKNIQKIVRRSNKGEGGQPVPPDAGCRKCGKCHACPIVKEGNKLYSTNTNKC